MKFLADEGVDKPIVNRLRDDGYDVTYIAEFDVVQLTLRYLNWLTTRKEF